MSFGRQHAIDNQISVLRRALDDLTPKQEKLKTFIESHRRLLSPSQKLLPEILQVIFCYCLPTAHNAVMSTKEAPLLLGRVCRRWRQVSHTTPKLWTSIHISIIPVAFHNSRGVARKDAVSSWLSRSGVLPLYISMTAKSTRTAPNPGATVNAYYIQPYLDVISEHTHRWRSLHLMLNDYNWSYLFTRFSGVDFPALESLCLEGNFPRRLKHALPPDHAAFSGEIGILQAPCLRKLSFPSFSLQVIQARVHWRDLTGLDLGSRPLLLTDVVRIITKCPNLENCTISLHPPGASAPGAFPSRPITMPTLPVLRTLSLTTKKACFDEIFSLLDGLSTPALRHLSLHNRIEVDWPIGIPLVSSFKEKLDSVFGSFFRRLTHPLEELMISTIPFSAEYALAILQHVPDLKRLSLRGVEFVRQPWHLTLPEVQVHLMNDALLKKLIPTRARGASSATPSTASSSSSDGEEHDAHMGENLPYSCLCPRLEVLDCSEAVFSTHLVLEFLQSRTTYRHEHPGVAHLRRVCIIFSSRIPFFSADDHDLRNEIVTLEQETGLLVSLRKQAGIEESIPAPRAFVHEWTLSASRSFPFDTHKYFGFFQRY